MKKIAVIDTETNWENRVMSIGIVIADSFSYKILDTRYFILNPEYAMGGMFSSELLLDSKEMNVICSREDAIRAIDIWLRQNSVDSLFAYNASFDKGHLCELSGYQWFDIMRIAAYRQHNPVIPNHLECCSTGKLKRGYGVEPMLRMLSGEHYYCEKHNALQDAIDELRIMELLGRTIDYYACARV